MVEGKEGEGERLGGGGRPTPRHLTRATKALGTCTTEPVCLVLAQSAFRFLGAALARGWELLIPRVPYTALVFGRQLLTDLIV